MNIDISPVIYSAIEILKKSFGGTKVELVSKKMIRTKDDRFGVIIKIEGYKTFFGCESKAEDICIYGIKCAESFVFNVLKDSDYIKKIERKIKILKIKEINE